MKVSIRRVGVWLLVFCCVTVVSAREMSFEERVEAQRAIERVYYGHQEGATRSFEEAVPRDLLERMVRTYLRQSVALDEYWGRSVSASALERELQRIARDTLLPDRLEEIYEALGHDSFLVLECFARPVLVNRLTRNFFAGEARIHADARDEAARIRDRLVAGPHGPRVDRTDRRTMTVARRVTGTAEATPAIPANERPDLLQLDGADYDRYRARFPAEPGEVSYVGEDRHAFVVSKVLNEGPDEFSIAIRVVRKTPWDVWWAEVEDRFQESKARVVAGSSFTLPEPGARPRPHPEGEGLASSASNERGPCLPEGWDNRSLDDFPSPRSRHTAVWTGTEMIIWGGDRSKNGAGTGSVVMDSGGRYDPATDTWDTVSTDGAPGTYEHTAVWTGSEMIVWGGGITGLNTGGIYDPVADSWTETTTTNAPAGRRLHTAVWTGDEMVVWGGRNFISSFNTGGVYDPSRDRWSDTTTTGAPSARNGHTVVWTGTEMIVWGGGTNTGGRYDPSGDDWTATTTTSAPSARSGHTAVWTDTEMIIWGGGTRTGGRYTPSTDSWVATPVPGSTPEARSDHVAVWTGNEMVVWGGEDTSGDPLSNGGRFNPSTLGWSSTWIGGSPSPRIRATAVWTGDHMIVWGGDVGEDFNGCCVGFLNSGSRYDPAINRWTPTSMSGLPEGELWTSAVWTGTEMIVWGGKSQYDFYIRSGGRYDLLTDNWTTTNESTSPSSRGLHSAVWTGDEMIVWGGWDGSLDQQTGGRYDPIGDTWTATVVNDDTPDVRRTHSAVWTGDEMIVWGGFSSAPVFQRYQSGARYDPDTDSWTATSLVDAPAERTNHAAVWTGDELIVWGGWNGSSQHDTGGRYDPQTDLWLPTSLTNVPTARNQHTAVWSGTEMIIWGGNWGANTGGRYNPTTDSWQPTSTVGVPAYPREDHSAIWTGREMVIWGGRYIDDDYDSGGKYDPVSDTWTATTRVDAPTPRRLHRAVWTGTEMLVWTGSFSNGTGGRYLPGNPDVDTDGHCLDVDCDDANDQVWSVPGEALNLYLAADKATLDWSPPVEAGATSVRYDTLRSPDVTDFDAPATCLETDGTNTQTVDGSAIGVGDLYAYLVRATNFCPVGEGSVGNDSAGNPRPARICP